MSQETTEERLKALLDDPRTGLKDSSDSNKTRYAILALIDEGVQAHTDRVVEAISKAKKGCDFCGKPFSSEGHYSSEGFYYCQLKLSTPATGIFRDNTVGADDDDSFNQVIDTSIQIVKGTK